MIADRAPEMPQPSLRPATARLHRLLAAAHHGPHATVSIAAAVANVDDGTAGEYLDELVAADLLDREQDRYTYPEPLRASARRHSAELDTDQDRREAQIAIATALLKEAAPREFSILPARPRSGPDYAAHKPGTRTPYTSDQALAWFDWHRPNVIAAQAAMKALGRHDLTWRLAVALWGHGLYRHGDLDSWILVNQIGVDAAHLCGDLLAEGRLRCMLVHAMLADRRASAAHPHAQRALKIADELDDPALRASAYSALSKIALASGLLHRAEQMIKAAISHDVLATAAAVHTRRLGDVLVELELLDQAIVLYRAAAAQLLALGHGVEAGRCNTYLGRALILNRQWGQAKDVLLQALSAAENSGSPRYVADAELALGELHLRSGDRRTAAQLFQQAQQDYTVAGDRRGVAQAHELLTQVPC